jgi:hypothetical protein
VTSPAAGPSAGQLRVALDQRWIEFPVQAGVDVDTWAAQTTDAVLTARGIDPRPELRDLCRIGWARGLEDLRSRADADDSAIVGAFAFVPLDEVLPVVVVEAFAALLGENSLDQFVESLIAPEHQRFGPPDVTDISTNAGDAVRLRQLLIDETGPEPTVQTSLGFVWPGPQTGTVIVLSALFGSPVEAELCNQPVDDLARSLTVVEA